MTTIHSSLIVIGQHACDAYMLYLFYFICGGVRCTPPSVYQITIHASHTTACGVLNPALALDPGRQTECFPQSNIGGVWCLVQSAG